MKYLDENGLLYFWQKITNKFVAKETGKGLSTNDFTTALKNKLDGIEAQATKTVVDTSITENGTNPVQGGAIYTALGGKVDKVSGKGLSTNDFTTTLKNKLDGIATGAEVNQNAFSNVKVGNVTVAADAKTDTITFTAGTNVQITADDTSDAVTISATDTTYSDVTTSTHGLMTAEDKVKLNGIAEGATANTGTITGVSVNGTSVATSGVANITSMPASILSGAIPSAVTATTQSAGNNSTKIATTAFVKTAIDNAVTGAMTYKGSVPTYADLPTTGNKTGDIWNVTATGKNYAWDGTGWDDFGDFVDLSNYVQFSDLVAITNAEIDTIVAS